MFLMVDLSKDDYKLELRPIGFLETSFKNKNATPRQPSVAVQSSAKLILNKIHLTNPDHALLGLDEYSYVW